MEWVKPLKKLVRGGLSLIPSGFFFAKIRNIVVIFCLRFRSHLLLVLKRTENGFFFGSYYLKFFDTSENEIFFFLTDLRI